MSATSVLEMQSELIALARDAALRHMVVARGRAQAARYSWERSAKAYLTLARLDD